MIRKDQRWLDLRGSQSWINAELYFVTAGKCRGFFSELINPRLVPWPSSLSAAGFSSLGKGGGCGSEWVTCFHVSLSDTQPEDILFFNYLLLFFKSSPWDMFIGFRGRGREGKRKREGWREKERGNINQLPPVRVLTGDRTHTIWVTERCSYLLSHVARTTI